MAAVGSAFDAIVPVLIGRRLRAGDHPARPDPPVAERRERLGVTEIARTARSWLWLAIMLTGVYGGYFGAAQGVLLIAIIGIGLSDTLPRINAVKNVLVSIVNGVAGLAS